VYDLFDSVRSSATISPCGKYRYSLRREWGGSAFVLPIIMLNPSTADAAVDDPTIRRCMAFARREGFAGIQVVNLFAFRATSPDDMMAAPDPFGPEGSDYIERALNSSSVTGVPVLAAWGTLGGHRDRAASVICSAKGWGAQLVCLGTTKDGHPRHPLYVRGDQPFVPFPATLSPRPAVGAQTKEAE
jgi:hypothetical protein